MALILCHHCLSWVDLLGEHCHNCDFPLDLHQTDPSIAALCESIGELLSLVGTVRINRAELPDLGDLYETTNGLFFVPDRIERLTLAQGRLSTESDERARGAASNESARAGGADLDPRGGTARIEIAVERSRPMGPDDSDELAELLMRNPGAFFLSRRSIRDVRHTFLGWTIRRANGLVLRLKPNGDRVAFHERMTALADAVREAVCP